MSVTLTQPPALAPLLARGALLSPFKRPRPDADFPHDRLVLPELRVDLAKLAAYERVCGFATGADALPLTYPHVLGFPLAMRLMSGRNFPLPLLGLVHTSIDITRRRAQPATAEYELAVHVDELRPHRRGTEAAVTTELRSAGQTVWESRSTYLARHRTTSEAPTATEPTPREPLPALADWQLAGDVGRRYASASGDHNPIHLHPLAARLFGFPRALAHGMWTLARCLAAHPTPEAVTLQATFRSPVLLPTTVTYAATKSHFELRTPQNHPHLTAAITPLARQGVN
ncbi:MaoC family dehydratase [Streptomyces sp. NPDC087294]|uniref:MaoC family dehydratase n=1 Tax=Streptomyces sp. NPDC087294 TaxID=3365777 RepID=UPI003817D0E0